MIRAVRMPEDSRGSLLLSRMPGCKGSFEQESAQIAQSADWVISLTSAAETSLRSARYGTAIENGTLPWERVEFAIKDFGVPQACQHDDFVSLVRQAASRIRQGQRVLVHCAGGIGRTGTIATCILMALGLDLPAAITHVKAAGSHAETSEQAEFAALVQIRLREIGDL